MTGSMVRAARLVSSRGGRIARDGRRRLRSGLRHARQGAAAVGDVRADGFVVVHPFDDAGGAKSRRRSHSHPAFAPDGRRLKGIVNSGAWTKLFIAECTDALAAQ